MVLGELLIHALLASAMFVVVLPWINEAYKTQFINHARHSTTHLASIITLESNHNNHLMDAISRGEVVLAELLSGHSIKTAQNENIFGSGGDNTFYTAIPLSLENKEYSLQLGYDETETAALVASTNYYGLYIVIGYIFFAVLMAAITGPQLTKPLLRLGQAARRITSGQPMQRLEVKSNITEISDLILDLEQMRDKLVTQKEELAAREARISAIMNNVIDALITVDDNGIIQSFNLAAERMFGYNTDEVIGQNINNLFTTALFSHSEIDSNKHQAETINKTTPHETLGKNKNGSTFHVEASISDVCQADSCLSIVVCRDTSDRKQAENQIKSLQDDLEQRVIKRTHELATVNKELQHQALHDALTSLPNRVLMQDRLQQATRAAKRDGHALALMITDLDRFKEINDTLGHHYGDLLLQQVAVRMRSALRNSDTVARLGGDEFAVLLPSIDSDEQASQAALKIAEALEAPFILEDQPFHVGISIGIAIYPKDGDNSANLMRRADVAMYAAKRSQNDFVFYNQNQDQHSAERLALVIELRRAVEEKQLLIHYQPTIDLQNCCVIGAEALLRWQHPNKGEIAPDDFIPLAEQAGLIKNLTMHVIEEVAKQLHTWRNAGINIRISVNLSARNLHDADLADHVADILERWQIPPHNLQMEITESAIMEDPTYAMNTLSKLHSMGIELSIDDFGTGYSSLAYLKQLPVQEIKIDKSFVQDMLTNNEDKIIVRSTIDLAHNMGHKVIAEGVDSLGKLEALTAMGCDHVQGYHISHPLIADDFQLWLQNSPWWKKKETDNESSQLAAVYSLDKVRN
jgi:diguanylate cyclase (GGDEF)-like protein/PAS domain S-box-containing protein